MKKFNKQCTNTIYKRFFILLAGFLVISIAYIYKTNSNACGDLLDQYQETINNATFVKCKKNTDKNSTMLMSAEYTINGKHAHEIEKYLQNNFGMEELIWICCGREPRNGKYGEITLTQSNNSNRSLLIKMFSDYNEEESTTIERYQAHQNKKNQTEQTQQQKFAENEKFILLVELVEA